MSDARDVPAAPCGTTSDRAVRTVLFRRCRTGRDRERSSVAWAAATGGADQADAILLAQFPDDQAEEGFPVQEVECPDRFPQPIPETMDAPLEFVRLTEQRAAVLLHLVEVCIVQRLPK